MFSRANASHKQPVEEAAPQTEWPVQSVGRLLRERREELGLDVESVGAELRIKPIFLVALEQDRAQDLPGPAYAVGFIRAYADYLGFDVEWLLERYKAETAAVRRRPDLSLPVPLGERSLPGGPVLLVAAIIALCGYGTWYYLSTGAHRRLERVAAVPATLRHLQPPPIVKPPHLPAVPPAVTAGNTAMPPPAVAKAADGTPVSLSAGGAIARPASGTGPATPATPPAAARDDGTRAPAVSPASVVPASATVPVAANAAAANPASGIAIHAIADCWMQVRDANHAILFSRILKAGETYRVPRAGLIMRVGNAGALAIDVDGKAAPPLGPIGALRRDVVLDPQALLAGTAVRG